MRILHVEDDEDTRKLVECILHGKGWQVVSVENATSAFKLAAAGGFDLYLIDNWIEGDTENALCRGLRTLDPHTPILFYSGAVFPSDVASALGIPIGTAKSRHHRSLQAMRLTIDDDLESPRPPVAGEQYA